MFDEDSRASADPIRAFALAAACAGPVQIPTSIGHYRILREIGRGGMGIVYAAIDSILEAPVALKVLTGIDDSESRKRLLREARIAAAMRGHPNVVTIYEANAETEIPYVAMEFIEGEALSQWIDRNRQSPGPVLRRLEQAFTIGRDVAQGLEEAHRRGLVHRDIKPHNVMVMAVGRVKILDFGIARRFTPDASRSGMMSGTPHYMPPELLAMELGLESFDESLRYDPRSDLYGLGVTLYEMIALRNPWESVRTLGDLVREKRRVRHLDDLGGPPLSLPPEARSVLESMVVADRDKRCQNATEAVKRIDEALVSTTPTMASATKSRSRFPRWIRPLFGRTGRGRDEAEKRPGEPEQDWSPAPETPGPFDDATVIMPFEPVTASVPARLTDGDAFEESYLFGQRRLQIFRGDLTSLKADAFVTSDDTRVSMRGGVSARILHVGGAEIAVEARAQLPASVGEVLVTKAGQLRGRFVLHALIIDWEQVTWEPGRVEKPGDSAWPSVERVAACTHRIFDRAAELGVRSLAIPTLGAGAGGLDLENVVRALIEVIVGRMRDSGPAPDLVVLAYLRETSFVEEMRRDILELTDGRVRIEGPPGPSA